MFNIIDKIKNDKKLFWRLMSHFLVITLTFTLIACKKDKEGKSGGFREPEPVVHHEPTDNCDANDVFYVKDAFSGEDILSAESSVYVNMLNESYVSHIGGEIRTSASIEYKFEGEIMSSPIFFWNIGSKIYMSTTDIADEESRDLQSLAAIDLSPIRGSVSALAAFKLDESRIGLVVGTTTGLAYLTADPSKQEIEIVHHQKFPITRDLSNNVGVTSITIKQLGEEDSYVYLTTTDKLVLSLHLESLKGGRLGCYSALDDLTRFNNPKYIPTKTAFVGFNEHQFLVYLAKQDSTMNKAMPITKKTFLTPIIHSMLDDKDYSIVRAIDLRSGEKIKVENDQSNSHYDRWRPLDIEASPGQLVVLSLMYDKSAFSDRVVTEVCENADSKTLKTTCLLGDGVLDIHNTTEEDPLVLTKMNDGGNNKITTGLATYTIPTTPIEIEEGDEESAGVKIFKESTSFQSLGIDDLKHKEVPPFFMSMHIDRSTLFIRGTSRAFVFNKGDNGWRRRLELHSGHRDIDLPIGLPSHADGVKLGTNYYFLDIVHTMQNYAAHPNGVSISTFFKKTGDKSSTRTVNVGLSNPSFQEIDDNDLLYIRPVINKMGKVYVQVIGNELERPEHIPFIEPEEGGAFYSMNATSSNNIYCYDLYRVDEIIDLSKFHIECRIGLNSNKSRIDISTEWNDRRGNHVFLNFPFSQDNPRLHHTKISDMKLINGQHLLVLFSGFNDFKTYTYRVARYKVVRRNNGISLTGPVGITDLLPKSFGENDKANFTIDNTAKFLDVKLQEGERVEGFAATQWGLLSFEIIGGGTEDNPRTLQNLDFEFEVSSEKNPCVEMTLFENILVTVRKQSSMIEFRRKNSPSRVLGKVDFKTGGILVIPGASAVISEDKLYLNLIFNWISNSFYIIDMSDPASPRIEDGRELRGSYFTEIVKGPGSKFVTSSIRNGIEMFEF